MVNVEEENDSNNHNPSSTSLNIATVEIGEFAKPLTQLAAEATYLIAGRFYGLCMDMDGSVPPQSLSKLPVIFPYPKSGEIHLESLHL